MNKDEKHETNEFWNRVAHDWDIQVGDEGDSNRIMNSDPVLWKFAGNVAGLKVLDAGCGTGYLSRKLQERGAYVTGIDFSEKMIEIARAKSRGIDFRVDSCSDLATVGDDSVDMIIANYVIMDTSDLAGTIQAFSRVLITDGIAILIFSHPCFPADWSTELPDSNALQYKWSFPYFEQRKCIAPPWGHFTSEFIWFHRPLSDYWKAFKSGGFIVTDFEEPRLTEDRYHLAKNERQLRKGKSQPYSVAFKLKKSRDA